MAFGKHKGRLLIDLPKPYEVRYIRKKVNKYSMRVKAPFLISLDGQARHKSGGQVFLEAKEARCIGKHKTVAIIVRANAIKHLTVWVFISLALACLCRCASFGPTSPNPVYQGPYPPKHYELLHKNPPLAQELGKLPEIQDGISDSEASGLEQLFDLYDKEPERFDAAFEQMYAVGKPEVRKFCTPLQALFWLAEDGELHNAAEILASFSLEKLSTCF